MEDLIYKEEDIKFASEWEMDYWRKQKKYVEKIEKLQKNVLGVTEFGGIQSKLDCDFTLIPPQALIALAEVVKYGEDKYKGSRDNPNYRKIPIESHLNHAMNHIVQYLNNDNTEDHLAHAMTRLVFCVALEREKEWPY